MMLNSYLIAKAATARQTRQAAANAPETNPADVLVSIPIWIVCQMLGLLGDR